MEDLCLLAATRAVPATSVRFLATYEAPVTRPWLVKAPDACHVDASAPLEEVEAEERVGATSLGGGTQGR